MFYFNRLEIIGFMILKSIFFYFYFLNIDISVNICVMGLTFPVWVLKVPLVSQACLNSSFMPSFLFYVKKRVTFCYFLKCKLLHFINENQGLNLNFETPFPASIFKECMFKI